MSYYSSNLPPSEEELKALEDEKAKSQKRYEEARLNLLSKVPKKYRDNADKFAYRLGHSAGNEEVLMYLEEIVDLFDI